ncbi:outer membrane beta-barrel protein [Formosa algae]|uniref:outer membrane beta-barrel protein n=1 Tax=Formosa algae TaxID=225843 RepID=UPI000CCE6E0F|nr:outer membrane beta-barrel protein [Formosa algae]PNW27380.1 hypothetical protein BKP44_13180 [Formosa algae]
MKYLNLIFLLSILTSYSQTNYVEGKIITNDNETISGFINDKQWISTPSKIEFKQGENTKIYTSNDILGFEIGENRFISKTVSLDVTNQSLNQMEIGDKAEFENKRIFLNTLVEGKASLYEYFDYRSHFFIKINDEFQELIYRKILRKEKINGNSKTLKSEYKKYQGQVGLYFSDCKSITINNFDYKRKQLQKLFNEYNACMSTGSNYSREVKHDKIDLYVNAGVSFSNFKVDNQKGVLKGFPDQNFTIPVFGIAADFNFKEDIKKWSLYTELTYRSMKRDIYYLQDFSDVNSDLKNELNMDFQSSTLQLITMLRYKFAIKNTNVIPFVNLGIGLSLDINSTSDLVEVRAGTGQVITYEDALYFNTAYFNYPMGVGVMYKNLACELRYDLSSNMSSSEADSTSKINGVGILLSYNIL